MRLIDLMLREWTVLEACGLYQNLHAFILLTWGEKLTGEKEILKNRKKWNPWYEVKSLRNMKQLDAEPFYSGLLNFKES